VKRAGAIVLLALVLLAFPAPVLATHTTTHVRCDALNSVLNLYRARNLRTLYLLCRIGWQRAKEMAYAGRAWHDLRPVVRALTAAGICWRNVGEVTASTTRIASAKTFMYLWRTLGAETHWPILLATRYDRGGGSWKTVNGRSFAAYYVLDLCP